MEERKDKLVWMQKKKGAERRASKRLKKHSKREKGSVVQRGKGTAKQRTVRRTRKRSKGKRERHAHREEKHSKREG